MITRRYLSLSLFDLLIAFNNVIIASKHSDIGYENADRTYKEFTQMLKEFRVRVKKADMEEALWACTQLDEMTPSSLFVHPEGLTLEKWIEKALPSDYDFFAEYSFLEKKE